MIIKGSVKGDGRIGIDDLILAQAHILGVITLDDDQIVAGDINEDGRLTALDLFMMQRHIHGTYIINKYIV